jgi:EAL domain-containing protein (putative c-di-GMP-specific phosphodiesterase class I)
VQGYYFSRPLPPAEFEALIEKELKIERENEA